MRALSQGVQIDDAWKLRTGDSLAWAAPSHDDSAWKTVRAGAEWEKSLGKYDGFGWYRREVVLPEGLENQQVGLLLSTVGDAFEVYWNGERIVQRGSFPPHFQETADPSLVMVESHALKKARGGRHVVAVRVYNYYGLGGLIGGVRVGSYEELLELRSPPGNTWIVALISVFLAIGVYHLAFFVLRHSARENLWFAALCGAMALFGATQSTQINAVVLPVVYPYRLRLLALMAAGPVFLALVYRLFNLRFTWRERVVSTAFILLFAAASLFPLTWLWEMKTATDLGVGVGLVVVVWRVVRASSPHVINAKLLVAGTAAFALALAYDVASMHQLVPATRVIPGVGGLFWAGFLLFILAVGTATAAKWATAEATALVDPLTQLSRRHVFEDALRRETERLRRTGGAVGVVMIDLDHFKRINDTYGHPAGDSVLGRVGRLLRLTARNADVTARYGGEEFAVLLCEAGLPGAISFAERFRQGLRELEFEMPGVMERVTASVGVAVGTELVDPDEILHAADRALYRAKVAGRDRVVAVSLPGLGEVGLRA